MLTERTVEEAEAYIQESIKQWKEIGQEKRIISLSNLVEKWRSNTVGHIAKMRGLQKNIRALKLVLERDAKISQSVNNYALQGTLDSIKEEYARLVETHGELKTNKEFNKAARARGPKTLE
jgi:hypothetical protein